MHETLAKEYEPGKELVPSETFASKVLEAALSGIYVFDFIQGCNVFINTRYTHLTGYTLEDLQSLDQARFFALFHPDDHQRVAEHLLQIQYGADEPAQIEYRFKTKDGRWIWCLSSNSAFARTRKGVVTQLVGSFIDVTDRKRAEQAENQVRGVNRQLEQRVAERTAEIEKQYKTLEKLNALIKQLSLKTIAAIENDRKALSKEIHDNIGGSLSAIKMMLETDLNRYGSSSRRTDREIIRHLADTIKETKRISFQMRSLALDEFGLQAAIAENIKIFKSFHPNIAVDFHVDISPERLPEEITLVLYRVVQEGLNNVGKHSGANEVKIVLNELKEHIYIEIEDNGHGLAPSDEPAGCREALQHLGIHSIKERVEICDGTFHMEAIPGRGTRLKVFIPKKF